MTGAECLLRTLTACGIDTCFMNPGTSEMQFVAALDRVPEMRGVLCLAETVCAGAADGYARMARRPASVLLHLGPGLANALSNLHNARKARSPVVNIVGEHATHHMAYDAPLTADIEAIARPVSNWVKTVESARAMGRDAAEAARESRELPAGVATLIVPADHSWSAAGRPGEPRPAARRAGVEGPAIDAAVRVLREGGEHAALMMGGEALLDRGMAAAARIQAATGARVFANRYAARMRRGRGTFSPERIPYFPEPAAEALAGVRWMVLAEAQAPVSFFGYPGRESLMTPEGCEFHTLAGELDDAAEALEMVADALGAGGALAGESREVRPMAPGDVLTLESLGAVLAMLLPEGAIVSDEMVSSGETVNRRLADAAPHDLLPVTGGSIGQGLPVGVGAAAAMPGRKVVCLEADGSGMYSLQSLWTMARLRLDVVTVIFANRRYRILDVEMQRTGAGPAGPKADEMLNLSGPALDWVSLARGHGVEAARAGTVRQFADLFGVAMRERGPFLIEAVL